MAKIPRVIKQLEAKVSGAIQMPYIGEVPEGATPISRLGYVPLSFPFQPEVIANAIRFRKGGSVFCDTSIFISKTDPKIWEALLEDNRMTIIQPILEELKWWIEDERGENASIREIIKGQRDGKSCPANILPQNPPADLWHTIQYYTLLLGARKLFAEIIRERILRQEKRTPSNQEVSNTLQKIGTSRAQLLAKQGASLKVLEHMVNDEYLVASALVRAIASGEESTILTADEAVFDQFHKATCLMTWQYTAMHVARIFADSPSHFEAIHVRNPEPGYFVEDEILLLKRTNPLPIEYLPSAPSYVHVHCMLLRPDSVMRLTFSAEREIAEMYKTKISNRGLNTGLLDGKNCHLFPPRLCLKGHEKCAVVATDISKPEKHSGIYLSPMDLELSLHCDEVFSHVELVRNA